MNRDTSHDRTGQPDKNRDTYHESNHGLVGCRSSNTRQLGCVFQDMEPPKLSSILRKSSACHDRTGQPVKRSDEKLGQNSSKRQSSDARQLGCVFQDMTPPKSILPKCTGMPKPIQRVKFTEAVARHTKIRDQNPSLG